MKKKLVQLLILAGLTAAAVCAAAGCSPDTPSGGDETGDITLNNAAISLVLGENRQLIAQIEGLSDISFVWASSDDEVVSVNDTGNVTALRAGTATVTASYGDKSASCAVDVSLGGYLPSVSFDYIEGDTVQVDVLHSVNLSAKVLFNGEEYDDAEVGYELSDETLGTIEDGIFTPSKVGNAVITVTASWRNVSSDYLTAQIAVNVIHNYQALVNGAPVPKSVSLYTLGSFEGETYVSEMPFEPSLAVDGISQDVNVSVEDEGIVKYDGTKLIAEGYGETEITLLSDSGSFSQVIEVIVSRPVAEYAETIEWFSALDGELTDDEGGNLLTKLFPDGVVSASQDGTSLDVSQPGKILGVATSSSEMTETAVTVYSKDYGYIFNVEGYTKVIDEAADLDELTLTDDRKLIEGYFILTEDIDMMRGGSDLSVALRHPSTSSSYLDDELGFRGVFDGNGHKIDKLYINGSWGFFACASNLTVKDLAFTNVNASGSAVAILFGTWCGIAYAPLYIENVYVHFAENTRTQRLAIFKNSRNGQVKVNNFILDMPTPESPCTQTSTGFGVGMFLTDNYSRDFAKSTSSWAYKGAEMENMYIISAPAQNGRVLPLVQYAGLSVYAANDYAEMAEAQPVTFEDNVPVADANGADKVYHYQYAVRYDSFADMMADGVLSVGGWSITDAGPVWIG